MVTDGPRDLPKVLQLYLEISQYPILASRIRERMRQELFARTVITPERFEAEVREKAVQSQQREGVTDPTMQEPVEVWNVRLAQIRDHLTDFYFAYNLPHDRFREIVVSIVGPRTPGGEVILSFNPELAPWQILFSQAEECEALPPERKAHVQHHLREIIVVLIKALISDQLPFVGLAKELFTIADLKEIRRRRIGRGKIGGKAAGLLLAWRILQMEAAGPGAELKRRVVIPDSYYIGADVFYDFHSLNHLTPYMNQKYLPRDQMEATYPQVSQAFQSGRFPEDVAHSLLELLEHLGKTPLIVRSSSLLEDNFGMSFAGKYESIFCPNQGSTQQNLDALTKAIARIYAGVLSPSALIYRQKMGLVDYDERMAILLQAVQGERYGDMFFPAVSGVGFSRNPFRWDPRIRREDGFLRLVCGLGTRAVERVGADYPRMVALSHPTLRPEVDVDAIRRYSQRYVDALDLAANTFVSLPFEELIGEDYPLLGFLFQADRGGYLVPVGPRGGDTGPNQWTLTLDGVLQRTPFVLSMKTLLQTLEEHYQRPVDVEFTADIVAGSTGPQVRLHLLQCRPQSSAADVEALQVPRDVPRERILFSANRMVPTGRVADVRYVIYVPPDAYNRIPTRASRAEIPRIIGRLNHKLDGEQFILIGPGRWGSSSIDLGIRVSYADIHNSRMLIEVGIPTEGQVPELSYGTHFFQDLVESRIYPLALFPGVPGDLLNEALLLRAPNALPALLPEDADMSEYVRVVDLPAVTGGQRLQVVMNGDTDEALGYLT